ncbi:multiple PDZ domain protein, partial [Caerostris extrusa]
PCASQPAIRNVHGAICRPKGNFQWDDFELSPVKTIRIHKGTSVFGMSVNIVDSVGVVVTSVTPGSACALDGRLRGGDTLVSVNGRSLLDAEPRVVGEVLRSVDKSTTDVVIQYIPEDSSETSNSSAFHNLQRPPAKSDEEEDEYFDVSETEPPPPPPPSYPPTCVEGSRNREAPSEPAAPPPPVVSKLSPHPAARVQDGRRPANPHSKPLNVGSMVSKVKPTVPFKPLRTSLSPKDAFPARAKSKSVTTIESVLGETSVSRQWGSERTLELNRDPVKGLGISIISGKLDVMRGGIFIKNVLPDSPAGWNGTLKRGDRILEVSGVDVRSASHAKAVDVIKNAPNPVQFIIQSLVPLLKAEKEEPVSSSHPTPSAESPGDPLPSVDAPAPPKQESPVTPALTLQTLSASSSNSSSRESTLKRGPAPASPSEKGDPGGNRPSPRRLPVAPDAGEEADQVPYAPLAEGKVLTKKGKQIDASSAGNVKLNPVEKAADPESEDDYGYTHNLSCMNNRWPQT